MDFSKDKFLQIIENINESYFEVDLKGNFTFFNESLCKLIGYSKEELMGLSYINIVDEENRKKVFEGFNSVYKTGKPLLYFDYQFMNKLGEKVIGETSVYLKYDSKGNKIGFYGLFRDITKKKEEEELFKKETEQIISLRTRELKESEEKFHQLFNKAPYPIGLFDLKGNLIDCNSATNILLSTSTLEDYIGKNYREFWFYNEKEKPLIGLFNKTFDKIIKTGKTVNFEFPIHRTVGPIVWNSATASKIRIGNKEFIQIILMDISAQKEAQEKLKESEEKYRNLVENAHEGVWAVDENDITIFVNPKLCEMLGYARDELMGKSLYLFLEDSMIDLIKSYRERREKGLKDTYELDFVKKDGTLLSTSINAAPIFNEIGVFKGSFAFINDITNRKIAEQKLKESEEKYRIISENANDLITITDTKMKLTYINEQVHRRVMGYTEEDIMGIKGLDLIHPDDREIVLQEFVKSFKTGGGFVEARIKHKDGHYIWTETSGSAIKDKNSKSKILLITRVIDERKKTEQKLKESELRYRNLIESVPFSIALINQQGIITYCNPIIEKLLGYNRDELVGHQFKDIPALHPKYLPIVLRRFNVILKGEILPPLEIELYKKDGSLIWVRYQSTLVKLGNEVLLQTVLNDITEQKHADLLIEEEIIKLKELDQIRKDLISRVSHELKTPLVSICGAAELLLDSFIDEFRDEPKELVEMIEKGGKRLKYLVDNLVDITRIEYQKFKLEKDLHDFNQIVRDCVKELMYLIRRRDLTVKLDLADGLYLEIDRVRMEQVILNLLSNAIKNTPPAGKIKIKSLQKDNSILLSISDTGIGLTKEEIDKLFIRFGKIERYGDGLEYIDIQGTGLGLYISKEIIDLHEGQIWVESAGRDKGSKFSIKIPIKT